LLGLPGAHHPWLGAHRGRRQPRARLRESRGISLPNRLLRRRRRARAPRQPEHLFHMVPGLRLAGHELRRLPAAPRLALQLRRWWVPWIDPGAADLGV